jgi:competence ComEA-like helix-hairpin-helix protein
MNGKNKNLVDINTATLEALTGVNGIGPSLAKRIIAGRPYPNLEALTQVSGISDIKLAKLLPSLTVEPPKNTLTTQEKALPASAQRPEKPIARIGETEAFVFFEDENEFHDALLIILAGFILGLIILILRPSD